MLFRNVPAGGGYRVRLQSGGQESGRLVVHTDAPAPWDPGIYGQSLPQSGYGYLTTRDGTKLAIDVRLPLGSHAAPYPTVIEYSGYGYADPAGPQSGIATLAQLMGFAVVDVNMRGTGCSGGAFDYFEPLQNLDGYDVIEAVAHQPWVLGHKVGMIGISYGAHQPAVHRAARSPGPRGDLRRCRRSTPRRRRCTREASSTRASPPAGRSNARTTPSPPGRTAVRPGPTQRIQGGDTTCAANQALHGEAANLDAKIAANSHYVPATANPLDPVTFVHKITVPVFLACQWEDEQTGGQCPELVRHFTGTTQKWFTFTNGAHIDSLDPDTFDRWYDFLELFVAHRAPATGSAALHAAAPLIYQSAMGLPAGDRSAPARPHPADPDVPRRAGRLRPVARGPRALRQRRRRRARRDSRRAPATRTRGSRGPSPRTRCRPRRRGRGISGPAAHWPPNRRQSSGVDEYTSNAHAVPLTDYAGTNTDSGGLWSNASAWQWDWQQNPAGTAVSYVTAPLASDTTVIGGGAVRPLGAVVDAGRGPPGDGQRGAA